MLRPVRQALPLDFALANSFVQPQRIALAHQFPGPPPQYRVPVLVHWNVHGGAHMELINLEPFRREGDGKHLLTIL